MVTWFTMDKKSLLGVADMLNIDVSVVFHVTDFSAFQPVGCKN